LLPAWFETLERMALASRKMPRDVSTRWNSSFDMLKFALEYREAIDELTSNKIAGLRQFELNEGEWGIAGQLYSSLKVRPLVHCSQFGFSPAARHWQVFKDATLFFSRSTPNLATVIPAMDHIDEMLTASSLNSKYSPSIRAALSIAKKTSNRYYNATDQSEVYRITMSK
jgi:hypothetical protein